MKRQAGEEEENGVIVGFYLFIFVFFIFSDGRLAAGLWGCHISD